MERVAFRVSSYGLNPADDEARAVMAKLAIGETVGVEIYRERHNKFASRVHFIFKRIAESFGMRVRNVRGWVAAQTGRADLVIINGKKVLVPWGTGPRDMNAADFENFWTDARDVIHDEILPTLQQRDQQEIRDMIEAMTIH